MRPEWLTVVRFRYAHEHDNAPLAAWLRRLAYLGAAVRDSCFTPRVDLTRNMEVGRWLEEDRTQYLLILDSDMVPVDETNAVLTADGPVVACAYVDQHGHAIDWKENGIQTGCLRLARDLMLTIPPPWFEYKVSEDIRKTTQGEAYTFSQKLLAAGQVAKIVGRIGHMLPMVALPPTTEGAPTEVRYGWQFLG
jgi:hypothetical protein